METDRIRLPFPARRLATLVTALLAIGFAVAGCTQRPSAAGPQTQDAGGLRIQLDTQPSPPRAGDNTLVVTVTDAATNQPVVDANVTVSSYNKLAGGGDQETGRSQGNGVYNVPMRLALADQFTATVTVQRVGHPDATAQFHLVAQ